MHFPPVLLAGCVAASLCLSSSAQVTNQSSGPQQQQQAPAPAQGSAPQLKLETLPPDPHTPTPEEQAAAEAVRQRAQISRVALSMANWGPKASSPGVTMTMKETGREKVASGTMLTYRLSASGFAPGTRLTLLRWPLNQGVTQVMNGIVLDASGTAVCGAPGVSLSAPGAPGVSAPGASADGASGAGTSAANPGVPACTKAMQPGAPVEITTTVAKGEAVRVGLLAEDRKSGAAASAIP